MSGKRARSARRLDALRKGFTWGYTSPKGFCEHEPPCHPDGTKCRPHPKQFKAHASKAEILFYGGAVGGGKTEFDIVEALAICLEHPGVQVAIFRRFHEDLKKNVITRFREIVPDHIAHYNSQDHALYVWNGSIIWFCHCRNESEVYRYQGLQVVALFIDEASHFSEFMVKYLITRVRSVRGIRKRVRLTSNPGGIGHGWLKRWFIRPTPVALGGRPQPRPFEIWRPLPELGDPTPPEDMLTRQFIPAYFRDNYALAQHDPRYLAQIYALGGDKAKQLAEGDWDANDSMIVGSVWRENHLVGPNDTRLLALGLKPGQVIPWHIIPNKHWKPPEGALIYGSVDYGYGAPWSFHLHAALPGGHVRTFFEYYMPRVRDVEQAQMIRIVLEREGYRPEWLVLDPAMRGSRAENNIAKSIFEVYQDVIGKLAMVMPGAAGRSARVSRPQRWLDALQTAPDGLPYWTVTTACPDLIRTVPEVPWDAKDPDVEDELSENHAYEDVGRFFEARPFIPRTQMIDPFAGLDPISRAHHERLAAAGAARNTGGPTGVGNIAKG